MKTFFKQVKGFFARLWALIFPQSPPPIKEEKTMNNQEEILHFVTRLRTFGNRAEYKNLVDAAQAAYQPMTAEKWISLLSKVDSAVRKGSPGHDFGHSRRDVLAALALASDKNVQTYQPAEIVAGMIAGMFHDLGTSFVARYKDNEWVAGHAEDGAYRFYTMTEGGLLEENLRLLVSYAIASHTHYLKDIPCKDGSIREPWYYELFEKEGKKYGWAVLACRFADRLDTNGSTLMLRHLLANADALESGGQDLTGKTFYQINAASIDIMVTPRTAMIDVAEGKQAPTTLRHIANFAGSNFGNSVYSRDDYLFPTMSRLMGYKVAQATNLGLSYKPSKQEVWSIKANFIDPKKDLKKLLFRISRSPRFEEAWAVLDQAFSKLSAEDMAIWSYLTAYLEDSYDKLLQVLKNTIVDGASEYTTPVLPLIDDFIAEIS